MNVFTGTIFVVTMVTGWLMILWYAVIVMLGRDVRRKIRKLGVEPPGIRGIDIWAAAVYNLVTVLFTVGYFFKELRYGYAENQWMIVGVSVISVMFAVVSVDKLHHILMYHIACLDSLKNKAEDTINEETEK